MNKRSPKNQGAYIKHAGKPWLSKDDVALHFSTLNRSFGVADEASAAWGMLDEFVIPDLPKWDVLLHNELYGPEEDQKECVRRKYFGFAPREN